MHGDRFTTIADLHKMYGRGQIGIEVDESKRLISFVPSTTDGPTATILGTAEKVRRLTEGTKGRNKGDILEWHQIKLQVLAPPVVAAARRGTFS